VAPRRSRQPHGRQPAAERLLNSAFRYQLGAHTVQLAQLCAMVGAAMSDATCALLETDRVIADNVIAGQEEIAAMFSSARESTFLLLSMPTPVATDLRAVVDAVQTGVEMERLAAFATDIAHVVRRRYPDCPVPDKVRTVVGDMGALAVRLSGELQQLMLLGHAGAADRIVRDGRAMSSLHRQLVAALVAGTRQNRDADAVDAVLLGDCYQRFSDCANGIARRAPSHSSGQRSA
jgi:phosphate transport system protein